MNEFNRIPLIIQDIFLFEQNFVILSKTNFEWLEYFLRKILLETSSDLIIS